MLALGPDGEPRPVARASGWRLQKFDTAEVVHAPAPPLRPLSDAHSRGLTDWWDRNYVHSLDWRWLTHRGDSGPGESWLKPEVDLVKGESMTPLERLFSVADDANGIGTTLGTLFRRDRSGGSHPAVGAGPPPPAEIAFPAVSAGAGKPVCAGRRAAGNWPLLALSGPVSPLTKAALRQPARAVTPRHAAGLREHTGTTRQNRTPVPTAAS
jgi:hypothetical protein